MKALWFDGKLALREVPKPRPRAGEALIQVLLAGICDTDIQILKGYSNFQGILGHEFVGRVVECDRPEWLGKRVVSEINVACGACDWCRRELGRHCPNRTVVGIVNRPGAFAEFLAKNSDRLVPLSPAEARLVDPVLGKLDAKGLEPIRQCRGHRVLGLLCHGHETPPAKRESLTLLVTQIEHGKPFVLP